MQDAQRAAKTAAPPTGLKELKDNNKANVSKVKQETNTKWKVAQSKFEKTVPAAVTANCNNNNRMPTRQETRSSDKLYSHLARKSPNINEIDTNNIPPIVIQVGYHIHNQSIRGSTAKCIALLKAFQHVIDKFPSKPDKDLSREIQSLLFVNCLEFLNQCCPLSISQDNAIKYLRAVFNRLTPDMAENDVRDLLSKSIDDFIQDEIICSWVAIIGKAVTAIDDDDVLLTIGYSVLLKKILCSAKKIDRKFRVVVVDTRPRFEGKRMHQELLEAGISATYIFIDTVPYVMKEVTKVLMSAESLFANGHVMAAMGSSQIALIAHTIGRPVIVCCETYKFSERVHTDCFVHNELGCDRQQFLAELKGKIDLGPEEELSKTVGHRLNVLDVVYDLTPSEFISAVITEKGMLPTTSALPILRVRETK